MAFTQLYKCKAKYAPDFGKLKRLANDMRILNVCIGRQIPIKKTKEFFAIRAFEIPLNVRALSDGPMLRKVRALARQERLTYQLMNMNFLQSICIFEIGEP